MKPLILSFFSLLICCLSSLNGQAQISPLVDSTAKMAIVFDGTQEGLFLTNASGLTTGQGDSYTIDLWVRSDSTDQNATILIKEGESPAVPQLSLELIEGELVVWRGSQLLYTGTELETNEWVHVAVVVSSTHLYAYVNGVSRATAGLNSGLTESSSVFCLGSRSGSNQFVGWLDEFRFWSHPFAKKDANLVKHHIQYQTHESLLCYHQFNSQESGQSYGGVAGSIGLQDAVGSQHAISSDSVMLQARGCPVGVGPSNYEWTNDLQINLVGTGFSTYLYGSGENRIAVSRMHSNPNSFAGIDHTNRVMDGTHWYVSWFGATGKSGLHSFESQSELPPEYSGQPWQYHLFWRAENANGVWTEKCVAQQADYSSDIVTFACVLDPGQYLVVMGEPNFPTTQLEVGSCGASEVDIRQKLYAEHVSSDSMQFVVWNDATGYLDSLTIAGRALKLRKLRTPVDYSTTYNVKVRAMWNNSYGQFGNTCQVTTAGIPSTQIRPEYCGTEVSAGASLYAIGITNADEYIFQVSDTTGYLEEYSSTAAKLRLRELNGPIHFGRIYTIRVRAIVGTDSSEYGIPCDVTTEAWPITKLQNSDCGRTDVHTSWWLKADGVQLVDGYEFEVSHPGTGYIDTYTTSIRKFKLRYLPGATNTGLIYDVRVRTFIQSDTSEFGPVCQVAMQNVGARIGQFSEDEDQSMEAYETQEQVAVIENAFPNPFTTSITMAFSLSVDQSVEIQIYDSMGRMIKGYGQSRLNAGNHQFIWDGTNNRGNTVQPGTYIMTLRNDLDFIVRSERVLFKR